VTTKNQPQRIDVTALGLPVRYIETSI